MNWGQITIYAKLNSRQRLVSFTSVKSYVWSSAENSRTCCFAGLPLLACLRFIASYAFLLRRVCSRLTFPLGYVWEQVVMVGFHSTCLCGVCMGCHGNLSAPVRLRCFPPAPDPCSSLRMDFITCWRRMSVHWILTAHPSRRLQSVVLLSPTVLRLCRYPAWNSFDNWLWVHTYQIPFEFMQPMKSQYNMYVELQLFRFELNCTSVLLLRTGETNTPKQVMPCSWM